jgi:hypothetical protein
MAEKTGTAATSKTTDADRTAEREVCMLLRKYQKESLPSKEFSSHPRAATIVMEF